MVDFGLGLTEPGVVVVVDERCWRPGANKGRFRTRGVVSIRRGMRALDEVIEKSSGNTPRTACKVNGHRKKQGSPNNLYNKRVLGNERRNLD